MKKRTIEENIKSFCKQAKSVLRFLDQENIVTETPEQVADVVLRRASVCYPYDYLDCIYHEGFGRFLEDVRRQAPGDVTLCENILAMGTALLTEYGLDEEDYRAWVIQQRGEAFSCILLGVVGEELTDADVERLKKQSSTQTREKLLAANAAGQFNQDTGIYFVSHKVLDEEHQFRVFDQYLVYSKSFDEYDHAVDALYDAFGIGMEEMEDCVAETLKTSGAYGREFLTTLFKISEQFQESLQSVLTELTRHLRSEKIDPETIRKFRNYYTQASNESKNNLLELLTIITRKYVEFFPGDRQYSHEYINKAIGRDNIRRILMMPGIEEGFKSIAMHFGNDILNDVLIAVSNSAADTVINGMSVASFENKMKYGLEELDFATACSETIFTELRHRIEDKYYEILGVCNYCLDEQDVDPDLMNVALGSFYREKESIVSEEDLKSVLMNALVSYPYDSARPLGLLYLLFGDDAAEYDKIIDYRDIENRFEVFLSDIVEDSAAEVLRRLPAEDLNSTTASITAITEFAEHHQKLAEPREILAEYDDYRRDYELIEAAKAKAPQVKAGVNALIASAQDTKLIEAAKQGNGYAQYMLMKLLDYFGHGSHEFAWIQSDSSHLSKYLLYASSWEKFVGSRKEEVFQLMMDCAEHKIAGAATLAAEYLFQKNQISKAKDLLRLAEENGDPQAFRNHASYIREEKNGFYQNLHIADQLEEIASFYGVK